MQVKAPSIEIARQARKSRMLYEGGAKSLKAHVRTLERLYDVHWAIAGINQLMEKPNRIDNLSAAQKRAQVYRLSSVATQVKIMGNNIKDDFK